VRLEKKDVVQKGRVKGKGLRRASVRDFHSFRVTWITLLYCTKWFEMDKISPMRYAHDEEAVFSRESIEFFVDPNHTHDLYYQLAFNVGGSLYGAEGKLDAVTWTRDETKHRELMQAWLDDSRALGANDMPKMARKGVATPLRKWAEANQLEWK